MTRFFSVDIAQIVHQEISPGLPSLTLVSRTPTTRTDGNLAGGKNPTTTSYPCKGFPVENVGQLVDGQLVGRDEAIILITAKSIAAGAVQPKPNDSITYESAGVTRTRPIERVAVDGAGARWLCVVRG